jgi:adenine-specific DNA-methyltransferase
MWSEQNKIYAVQTNTSVVERCMLMATDPGDLIIDPTCGSGTSAYVAEQWGRRWITCDSSRVALSLAKYRIMTASFNYYKLANPIDGIRGGFEYSIAQRKTRESIGNNQQAELITLYDQPVINASIYRVTGSFTVEAVPAPYTKSIDELTSESKNISADNSISRLGETNRQLNWRDELLRTGVRAKNGNYINFSRVEPLSGTKFIQAEAETQDDNPQKVLVVFGPEHAPLEQRVVENAWQEARALKPDILLFCAFQFDNEAAKDIDELSPKIAGMQLLKAQMNADLFTDDLKKNRSSNDSFWLVGQPDIKVHKLTDGEIKVEVMGFDYYNPIKGTLDSGGKNNIASWMVDEDYDNRSIYPSQVFFPLEDEKYDWTKLARNLKAEIDTDKIESFKGTVSLPFKPGKVIAIKILDDRGLESLRVINI